MHCAHIWWYLRTSTRIVCADLILISNSLVITSKEMHLLLGIMQGNSPSHQWWSCWDRVLLITDWGSPTLRASTSLHTLLLQCRHTVAAFFFLNLTRFHWHHPTTKVCWLLDVPLQCKQIECCSFVYSSLPFRQITPSIFRQIRPTIEQCQHHLYLGITPSAEQCQYLL